MLPDGGAGTESASEVPAYQGYVPEAPEAEEEHIHLGPSSVWPITTAAGITLFGAGFVTDMFIGVAGVLVMFYAIVKWVQELRHEPH